LIDCVFSLILHIAIIFFIFVVCEEASASSKNS
jgi:hypothetical protein